MTERLISLYERIVLRHPALVLAALLAVLVALGQALPTMKLDASADSLTLEGDESLKLYRETARRYATEDFLLVTYRPDEDLYSQPVLDRLSQLREELAALPGVSSVNSILDVPLLDSPRVSLSDVTGGDIPTLRDPEVSRELAAKELRSSPLYKSLLSSPDGKTTALQVNIKTDQRYFELLNARESLRIADDNGELDAAGLRQLADAEKAFQQYATVYNDRIHELVASVRAVLDGYRDDGKVFLGGVPMIAADMITFVKSDLVVFGSGIAAFIVFLMTFIFRRLVWVVLPLLTCASTVVFMLGLLATLDWRMTVISSNFVALLLIITLSVTIHLVVRYRELAANTPHADQYALVRETVARMAKPCVYTTLTTVVAFASLVVSGIRPVIDFGWMMTIGVFTALVMAFVVLPAGLLLLGKPVPGPGSAEGEPFTIKFARIIDRFGGGVLVASVVLLGLSVLGISRLEVENRFIDYFHDTTEIYQGMEVIDAQLGGTIPLEVIISKPKAAEAAATVDSEFADDFSDDFGDDFGGEFDDDFGGDDATDSYWFTVAGMERIKQAHQYLEGLDETGKVLSLATLYELVKMIMGEDIDDLQLALAKRSLPDQINDILVSPYLADDVDEVRINVRVMETSHTLKRKELLDQVRHDLVTELGFEPDQVQLTGMLVLYNNMLQSLFRSQILTLGAVFVAIVMMFMVLFRSLSLALIAIAPNLLAAGAVLGGMGLFGLPLDMMTITIAAITVGIGVDDTIHYVHRFKSEFGKDRDYHATMYRCHGSIGKAMYYTSVIIIFGFSILSLSNFNPSIYFGLLTGAAMLAALMGALLLLPKLIVLFKPLGQEAPALSAARVKVAENA